MDTKRCSKCGTEYPATLEYFYANRSKSPDGLRPDCKTCSKAFDRQRHIEHGDETRAKRRQRRRENPEHFRERERLWAGNNRDKRNASNKRHYEKHGDKVRASSKRYYHENKDKVRVTSRRYYDANRDAILAYHRKYREDHRVIRLEKKHLYYAENRDRILEDNRKYRDEHPEFIREYHRQYRKKKPYKILLHTQQRRTRNLSLPNTFTEEEWESAIRYWDKRCVYCGQTPAKLSMDHYIPLSSSYCPGTVASNIVPCCKSCNSRKRHSIALHWLTRRFGSEKATQIDAVIQEYFRIVTNI